MVDVHGFATLVVVILGMYFILYKVMGGNPLSFLIWIYFIVQANVSFAWLVLNRMVSHIFLIPDEPNKIAIIDQYISILLLPVLLLLVIIIKCIDIYIIPKRSCFVIVINTSFRFLVKFKYCWMCFNCYVNKWGGRLSTILPWKHNSLKQHMFDHIQKLLMHP